MVAFGNATLDAKACYTVAVIDAATDKQLYHEVAMGCDVPSSAEQLHTAFVRPNREVYIELSDSYGDVIDW